MARIDEATISAIRKKHPINEIVGRYVSLTKRGDDYWGLCPFHADNHASMSVSTKLDMFQCFSCKKAGNVFNFISLIENISYGEAINLLAKEDGYKINSLERINPNRKSYEILSLAIKFYQNNLNSTIGENAINYLLDRKIDRETIKKFEIGLSTSIQPLTPFLLNKYNINDLIDVGLSNTDSKDFFNDRIMIPIHDLNGNPVGFGGRKYQTKEGSKYTNTKASKLFDKSNLLYNFHRAHNKLSKDDFIIIMEGYFDVIRASTIGVNNCVAPMGTSLTKNHINILKKITNHVILCFDGDQAGREATIKTIPILESMGMDVKVIRLEEKDPDEFIIKRGAEAFLDKIKHPLNAIDFKMQVLSDNKDLNDTKETSEYINSMLKELSKEKDEILTELTLKKISQRFNTDYKLLKVRFDNYKIKEKNINNSIDNNDNLQVKNTEKIPLKYRQAINNLLYYMIVSGEVIEYASNNITTIIDKNKRRLFNEIVSYYHKYGSLVVADFITYLTTNTDIIDTFNEIINLNIKKEYTKEEIKDYIKCVKEYDKKTKIEILQNDLRKEMDPIKQVEILKKINEIRGVNTSD